MSSWIDVQACVNKRINVIVSNKLPMPAPTMRPSTPGSWLQDETLHYDAPISRRNGWIEAVEVNTREVPGAVVHACSPSVGNWRQKDQTFMPSIIDTQMLRPTWAAQGPDSIKQKDK